MIDERTDKEKERALVLQDLKNARDTLKYSEERECVSEIGEVERKLEIETAKRRIDYLTKMLKCSDEGRDIWEWNK